MEQQQLEDKEKNIDIEKKQVDISNQTYIDDLKKLIKTNTDVPTHIPKKFVDIFYVRDNSGTTEFYVFINNTWKKLI